MPMTLQLDMQPARKNISQAIEEPPGVCDGIIKSISGIIAAIVRADGLDLGQRTFLSPGETLQPAGKGLDLLPGHSRFPFFPPHCTGGKKPAEIAVPLA